jgi:dsDNA-specific endonuclease/ATPase MutS2
VNEQAFATLEYGGLRGLVSRYAQTPMGRARAEALAPLAAVEEVRRRASLQKSCRAASWTTAPALSLRASATR